MRKRRETIVPHVPHHFILRGNNKRRLFSFPWEYRLFLQLLAEAAYDNRVQVHAFALMQNHVHLVVTPRTQRLASRFVQNFAHRYAIQHNKRRERTGKLFEQRFVSKPLNAAALAICTAYVDLNPVLSGTRTQLKWSSLPLHVGLRTRVRLPRGLWTPSPWYLGLGKTDAARQAAYRKFLVERARQRLQEQDLEPPRPRDQWVRRLDLRRAA
jgi:putative transposase